MADLPPLTDGGGGGTMTEAEALSIWHAASASTAPRAPEAAPAIPSSIRCSLRRPRPGDGPGLAPPAAAVGTALADRDARAAYLRASLRCPESRSRRASFASFASSAGSPFRPLARGDPESASQEGEAQSQARPQHWEMKSPFRDEDEHKTGASLQDYEARSQGQPQPWEMKAPFQDESDPAMGASSQDEEGEPVMGASLHEEAPLRKSPDLSPALAAQAREYERISRLHRQRLRAEETKKSPPEVHRLKSPPDAKSPPEPFQESDGDRKPPAFNEVFLAAPTPAASEAPAPLQESDWDRKPPAKTAPLQWDEQTKIVHCPQCNASLCASASALNCVVCQVCCTMSTLQEQVERPR